MATSFSASAARFVLASQYQFHIFPTVTVKHTWSLRTFNRNGSLDLVQSQSDRSVPWFARTFTRRVPARFLCQKAAMSTSTQAPIRPDSEIPETGSTGISKSDSDSEKWTIKMLYDGACPLCMREVNMLRERNKLYGTITFVDITADDYSAEENAGIDFATAMGRIHAVLRDGTILLDVAAFQKLYEEVGLGWVYSFTKFTPFARIADTVYSIWAKFRLLITGRPPLIEILEERQRKAESACKSDRCQPD